MAAQPPAYDPIADHYAAWVRAELADPASVLCLALEGVLAAAGPVGGLAVCDLGCGEGTLARRLADQGGVVTGVDLSARLLAIAAALTPPDAVRYVLDDAQTLGAWAGASFDLVVSNLALMDIPELDRVYAAVHRIVRAGGRFVFSIMHPCFQAPDSFAGDDAVRQIARYASEGFWRSAKPDTIRGRVGAQHRTLATVINALVRAGFTLEHLAEPTAPPGDYASSASQGRVEIPPVLVVAARRNC